MILRQIHYCVIIVEIRPVALPLEKCGKSGHRPGPGLYNPTHRIVVSEQADVSATILNHINLITIVNRLDGFSSWAAD
jgi:hypothetical protein